MFNVCSNVVPLFHPSDSRVIIEDDPQFVPGELHGRHLPGEALEERGEPLGVRLLFRGAGASQRAGERSPGDPDAAPLPHQRAPTSHLLRGRDPERGSSSVRHRVPASRRRHISGVCVSSNYILSAHIH